MKINRAAFLLSVAAAVCFAQAAYLIFPPLDVSAEVNEARRRPRIGLILEGGGAKGFAHVGVLKVLREERIPIDFIAGTSMGSIVGAAYASGRTLEEMEEMLTTTDWDALFVESPERRNVRFRDKSGRDREIYGDTRIGLQSRGISNPVAMVQGNNIEPLLQRLFGRVPSDISFDDLPTPFRAVAADMETGETVVLDRGNLAMAVRASMAVPGFFAPVEIDGRWLVDGAISNNFPVDLGINWGADVLIAVQFPDHLRKREELGSLLSVTAQILDMLLQRSTQQGIQMLRENDILVEPEIAPFGSTSFNSAAEIVKIGEEKARLLVSKFSHLALSEEEYALYTANRISGSEYTPVIDYVRVERAPEHRKDEIRAVFSEMVGQPLDRASVEAGIRQIQSSGDYRTVRYQTEVVDGRTELVIQAQTREWLRQYARIGFSLEDDFEGSSNYTLAGNLRFNELNSWGGSADVHLEVGLSPRVVLEGYQPLWRSKFFIAPELSYSRQQLLVRDGEGVVAEFARKESVFWPKIGYSFGRFGEFNTGWRWGGGSVSREVGEPRIAGVDYDIGEATSRFAIDQLDSPDFPKEGVLFNMQGSLARSGLGDESDYERGSARLAVPITYGSTTLLLSVEGGSLSSAAPIYRAYSLGGFFDVSGYEQSSLLATDYRVGRGALYHRIAEGGSALFPFGGYVGLTSEFAALRSEFAAIPDKPNIVAGSVFIGADTPLLPVYLAFGVNDDSNMALYFNLGRLSSQRR